MGKSRPISATTAPNYDDAVPPRLTRLELIGFKSFATKTAFRFERGITAIVGPNGSGKSNIADAVRWALGETSYNSLRSKKTEDVIFAGGQGKAPAGMAEVTLTFDNGSGWLPLDFAEVTVTRRAFRSGETAYLINGRRVRLKDIHQITASLGHSYTVVGQGLVDAALSQRAEERRGLFEHAADLTGLRLKAAEAERNLAETETNTARLTDLLAEVEPRLRSLERAARQANEYREVRDRLRSLQQSHFRQQLISAQRRLDEVEWTASEGQRGAESLQEEHDGLVIEATRLRDLREQASARLEEHRAGLLATAEQQRRVSHEREIATERLNALIRRREDMADTQGGLDDQLGLVETELAEARAQLATAADDVATTRRALAEAEAALMAERSDRATRERERSRLSAQITDRERQLADAARRRSLLMQRIETDTADQERTAQSGTDRADRLQRLRAELTALDQFGSTSGFRLTSIDAGVIEITTALNTAQGGADTTRQRLSEIERSLAESRARLRELQRIDESGAGLYAGVEAVLKASKLRDLTGIRGAISELIELPARFDTAIEVALGGRLQDIVVNTWVHAEAAIRYLKAQNAGRATFQPIDTVRGRRVSDDVLRGVIGLAGVHGVACDLLTVSPELNGIVTALLGRSLVVEDLDVARACLPHLPSGWNAVTLSGEIVRTAGSVTGGAAVRESGALLRERALRELPGEIANIEQELGKARKAADSVSDRVRKLQDDRQQLAAERSAVLVTRREREGQRARIVSWLDETTREVERADQRRLELDQNRADNEAATATIDDEIRGLTAERDTARHQLDEADRQIDREQAGPSTVEQSARDQQRLLFASEERLNAERRRESSLAAQLATLNEERAMRAERAAAVDGEIVALQAQVQRLATELAALETSHAASQTAQEPIAGEAAAHVFALVEIERELDAARTHLIEAERRRGLLGVDVERVRGEVVALRQRISDELDLDEPNDLLAVDESATDGVIDLTEAEEAIGRLKDRLRRVGYAGDNAVEDYERERERHMFLRDQLADVAGASATIRELLDDVRGTMRERFEETFARVSTAFSQMFSALFGGGSARLVMVAGEDDERGSGIDIVAQPPGKRLQSLALLSGGERALTGVALLFAILKVNPTPFCMLDEVDAALDEANVVRFRDQLQQLASETQAIIITHNRGTIEAANTLYGVSMRDDGISTVLSLRLSDVVLSD